MRRVAFQTRRARVIKSGGARILISRVTFQRHHPNARAPPVTASTTACCCHLSPGAAITVLPVAFPRRRSSSRSRVYVYALWKFHIKFMTSLSPPRAEFYDFAAVNAGPPADLCSKLELKSTAGRSLRRLFIGRVNCRRGTGKSSRGKGSARWTSRQVGVNAKRPCPTRK